MLIPKLLKSADSSRFIVNTQSILCVTKTLQKDNLKRGTPDM